MTECFIDKVLVEIDDHVQAWHEGDDSRPLHEYLGMTPEQYALWTESPVSVIRAAQYLGIEPINVVLLANKGLPHGRDDEGRMLFDAVDLDKLVIACGASK